MFSICTDYSSLYDNIRVQAGRYLQANAALQSMVVGLSGGIDSALTCAIASELVRDFPHIRLIGRSIPIESNTEHEINRARAIGESFCTDFEQKDLTGAFHDLYEHLIGKQARMTADSQEEKIRRGNIKARIRMIYLFDLAHYEKGMVLSTDNYTELLLGFWTLHGDVGNYGFIQYLWKTEVYGLARFLVDRYRRQGEPARAEALGACIEAVPTDGLGITASDFDQIGVPDYETVDRILIQYRKDGKSHADHPVIRRHLQSAFKRSDPQNIGRERLIPAVHQ